MRRAAKVDRNQGQIVEALRAVGASVAITSRLGAGFPDLVAGYRKVNTLIEVKDGEAPPSDRRLTPAQQRFFGSWRGQVCVVATVEEALRAIGAVRDAPAAAPGPELELLRRIVLAWSDNRKSPIGVARLEQAMLEAELKLGMGGGVRP